MVQPANVVLVWLGILYVLVMFGRFCDYFLVGLQLPLLFTLIAVIITILGGGLANSMRTKAGWCVMAMICWIPVTIPFSFWRSNSLQTYRTFLIHVVMFFVIAGLPRRIREMRTLYLSVCAAGVLLLLISLSKGIYLEGRLFLPGGMFQNANDLAMVLLISACLWCYFLLMPSRYGFLRLPVFLLLGVHALAISRTGSRGVILGIVAVLMYLMWKVSGLARVKLVSASIALVIFSLALLPTALMDRYGTISSSMSREVGGMGEAAASSDSRMVFLTDSIRFTITHPVFGIGPGAFAAYWGSEKEKQGIFVRYNVNHNAYLQISSETGFPGLLIYLALHILAFRYVGLALKMARTRLFPDWEMVEGMSIAAGGALAAYTVTSFFLSIGYLMPVYLLVGISAGLYNVTLAAYEQAKKAQAGGTSRPAPEKKPAADFRGMPPRLAPVAGALPGRPAFSKVNRQARDW